MVKKYYKAKRLAAVKMKNGKGTDWGFDMVGKTKAAAYARELRDMNVSYSRRKVGARTWRFKKK